MRSFVILWQLCKQYQYIALFAKANSLKYMRMYVCMSVCMYVCMYACMHDHVCIVYNQLLEAHC